jgi:hypothetical protein
VRSGWEPRAMMLFLAGVLTALVPSAIALAWLIWAGGIGEDPDQQSARVLPFAKAQPKSNERKARSA